jgi:hypothetical protein
MDEALHSGRAEHKDEGCMESSFEKMAKKLGLTPQGYETSVELKEWARQNVEEKYVPLYLLVGPCG